MEILDRYLDAVSKHLPRGQHEDIVAELSENLLSEMEQRAVELGRPLDALEQTAILERHGDPAVVADRYRKDQRSLVLGRQLIGPEWFALYWSVLWLTFGVTVLAAILIAYGLDVHVTLPGLVVPLFLELGTVTLVFALIDVGHRRPRKPVGLLDRYLRAVRDGLPRAQQDDIVAELHENLLSEIEDREAALGRPLAEVEREALLTAHGHPLVVAGRYRPDGPRLSVGRQLIGPVLFGLYTKVLLLSVTLSVVGGTIARQLFARPAGPLEWTVALLGPVIFQLAIITTVFAAIESWVLKNPGSWNQHSPAWAKPRTTRPPRVPRVESAVQLVMLAGFFAVLRGAGAAFQHASAPTVVASSAPWRVYWLALSTLVIAEMIPPLVNLVRPEWTGLRAWSRVAGTAAWLALVCFVLATGPWLSLTGPAAVLAEKHRLVENVNAYAFYGVLSMAVFSAGQLVFELRRLQRTRRRS